MLGPADATSRGKESHVLGTEQGSRPPSLRRALEGNLGVVDELVASDYIGHDPALPEPLRGPEDVKDFIATYLVAFPDARMTVTMQLAEGDLVATRWVGRGTHEGDLIDMEPTGKEVTVTGSRSRASRTERSARSFATATSTG